MNAADVTIRPLALTSGDPAGIGPDITLANWLKRRDADLPVFAVLGDAGTFRERAHLLDLDVPCQEIETLDQAAQIFSDTLPVLPVRLASPVRPGAPNASAVPAIMTSIERAVDLALTGEASAVVTNPIAKHVMLQAGFAHPGHTEFLGELAVKRGHEAHPVMMLAGGGLRTVPVTVHIPLADVPRTLTRQMIVDTAMITASDLRRWFGIAEPRLALTGLNPHAGENGMMGDEEERLIKPAIAELRAAGLTVSGPHPADTLFHERARQTYDAAIAMYHDQALIPLKTLAFDEGVNVTLGLPFIRTSPDHGTAFEIAGSGQARPDSLIAALTLAAQMARQADQHS
ncbi:MAG: 4-hydroxythreonine-4-phosphate dehydrogenase PdxA [Rhodomicrobiaceae bacterium]